MKLIIMSLSLLCAACAGPAGSVGTPGKDGAGCEVARMAPNAFWPNGGDYIACNNTTAFISNGVNGTNGARGTAGQDGTSCSVAAIATNADLPAGGSLLTCSDGTSSLITNGLIGANGSAGSNGADGIQGATGPSGAPGTVITAIQFCPGHTPTYPTTFAEVGFVIGTQVYGVYSANGGFMALLPPGRYSSDGVNVTCSFTINANGTVSP